MRNEAMTIAESSQPRQQMSPRSYPRVIPRFRRITVAIMVIVFFIFQNDVGLMSTQIQFYNRFDTENTLPYVPEPLPLPTLTLLDPYFLGGFRNQHMRFVAFINYAVELNISQVLLPSIRWGDSLNRGKSLQHEYLFDVKYWNERASEKELPTLVTYDANILEPAGNCFNTTSGLWNGLDEEYLRHNETLLRQFDANEAIKQSKLIHCRGEFVNSNNATTHLVPIGGGRGSGKFWNGYYKLQKDESVTGDRPMIEQSIFQLLRPSFPLRVAMERANQLVTANRTTKEDHHKHRLMALHPRVEHDMLTHRCHVYHEQNLTTVFERVRTFPAFSTTNNATSANQQHFNYDLIFVAVSALQVEKPPRTDPKAIHLTDIMIGNKNTLIHARMHGVFGGIPIFESGASTAKQVQFTEVNRRNNEVTTFSAESQGVVELVAQVINFFTSVIADVFIGVRGSSFSTDVFAVRYYLSKDATPFFSGNYIMSPDGIEELIGPPRVHKC